VQSSPQRASLPFADDAPARAELTPVVPSFSGVAVRTAPQEALESLERYKLLARLGQGGMAEVYLAAWEVAPFVHRPVVIKRLHPHFNEDPRLVEMFLDEARLLTQLDHPHIVKTLEAGVIDGRCCIAMEYLEGQPLQRVLRRAKAERVEHRIEPVDARQRRPCRLHRRGLAAAVEAQQLERAAIGEIGGFGHRAPLIAGGARAQALWRHETRGRCAGASPGRADVAAATAAAGSNRLR